MPKSKSRNKKSPKRVLALPDLEQAKTAVLDVTTPRARRDRAMLAMLIGCGLRRGELLTLTLESIQQREDQSGRISRTADLDAMKRGLFE